MDFLQFLFQILGRLLISLISLFCPTWFPKLILFDHPLHTGSPSMPASAAHDGPQRPNPYTPQEQIGYLPFSTFPLTFVATMLFVRFACSLVRRMILSGFQSIKEYLSNPSRPTQLASTYKRRMNYKSASKTDTGSGNLGKSRETGMPVYEASALDDTMYHADDEAGFGHRNHSRRRGIYAAREEMDRNTDATNAPSTEDTETAITATNNEADTSTTTMNTNTKNLPVARGRARPISDEDMAAWKLNHVTYDPSPEDVRSPPRSPTTAKKTTAKQWIRWYKTCVTRDPEPQPDDEPQPVEERDSDRNHGNACLPGENEEGGDRSTASDPDGTGDGGSDTEGKTG